MDIRFICEPLDAPSQCVHVGVLEDVGHHNDLVVSELRINGRLHRRGDFDEQKVCNCLPREFKVAVHKSRNARNVRYSVDDVANLIREPPNSRTRFRRGNLPLPWLDPSLALSVS